MTMSDQLLMWFIGFSFAGIASWLTWLTVNHFKYSRSAYSALTGDQNMGIAGHISETDDKFEELLTDVERLNRKFQKLDQRTDKIYALILRMSEIEEEEEEEEYY